MKKTFFLLAFYLSTSIISANNNIYTIGGYELLKQQFLGIRKDLKAIAVNPIKNKKQTFHFTLTTLGLIATDYPTTDFIQDYVNPLTESNLYKKSPIGLPISSHSEYIALMSAGLYTFSLIQKNNQGQAASIMVIKAGTYSYLYSHLILKSLFGRKRPAYDLDEPLTDDTFTKDPLEFGNFHEFYFNSRSDGTGMPSFHFTMFFSAAKVLQKVYNNYWIPYTLCAIGLLPSFEDHHHWTSDMVAGALIGTMIGNQIVENYYFNEEDPLTILKIKNINIIPLISFNKYGVMIKKEF